MRMKDCVATIGFFDGVHRGHQFVVGCTAVEARALDLEAVVITFDRSPREVVRRDHLGTELLTTREQTEKLILAAGADRCEVLHFDEELAVLTAKKFMRTVLKEQLGVRVLVLGYDNRFGRRLKSRNEGFADYVRYGKALGIKVINLAEITSKMLRVPSVEKCSSSAIRQCLRRGDVESAASLLGRPYSIIGRVVQGRGEGRQMGFPTANLSVESVKTMLPASGVYEVEASVDGESRRGMMNIGTRPTFNDGNALSLEVHLFDFDGNLYDRQLTVTFVRRIRAEQTFASVEELRHQLELDQSNILSHEKI